LPKWLSNAACGFGCNKVYTTFSHVFPDENAFKERLACLEIVHCHLLKVNPSFKVWNWLPLEVR
jgi:hypothetical protein